MKNKKEKYFNLFNNWNLKREKMKKKINKMMICLINCKILNSKNLMMKLN